MYFKLGRQSVARKLFDEMPIRDVVSYNTLIAGYSSCGQAGIAREVFDSMSERSFVSWSAMIAGYSKSGDLDAARELFERMPERNVVCWNAMIAGYAQNERFSEAVKIFRRMLQVEGMKPNEVTLVSVLSACANLGALGLGKWIHRYVERASTRLGLFLGNALSDMYSKCGCIAEARKVFDEMPERDVISWSIIVTGTAMHGLWNEAIACFHEMLQQGTKPNDITFMGILSACTHAGLVDDGLEYFDRMSREFGIDPKVEHYGCVVDLLSRAGRLDEAENLISSMRVSPNAIVWGALLGGCRIYGDVDRGERAAHRILQLDPDHSGSHIYLANAYASVGKLEEAAKYRVWMREKQVVKTPGCSWIEIDNAVYEFLMGDRSHPQSGKIYAMIRSLAPRMKLAGYVPNTSLVCQSIDEEEKENALAMHSEKLAVAFGLVSTEEGATIRVVKNLRVCKDCHDYMKVMSQVVAREIVLRDRNRFHHFKDGVCSCKDYW
ncbi:pentatricopeptide repeat-containing protein ELI1, chloroplastic-like [Asparagus officinalis]|uniref:pentatricopeptide repeat-containing protein ELI1, chloroplastic-like n=1 Tax=Asparagus officinalis TaxID=4686 RepID=UPI00098E0224|nr:pentatricopeptide repeat-containing protein ELI1, chloroplastic-like [Asparagus officinalis]